MATAGAHYPPPPPFQVQHHYHPHGNGWSTGLYDCRDDIGNCCFTCWCPCIVFGRIAEIVDRGSSSCESSGALYWLLCCFIGFQPIYSCFYRKKLRDQYSLPEAPCDDCLVHWCCEHCALCQEYRELKHRGFNMSIGWQANVERMGGRVTMDVSPPKHMEMNR